MTIRHLKIFIAVAETGKDECSCNKYFYFATDRESGN
jgi:hypothetical protein